MTVGGVGQRAPGSLDVVAGPVGGELPGQFKGTQRGGVGHVDGHHHGDAQCDTRDGERELARVTEVETHGGPAPQAAHFASRCPSRTSQTSSA